MRPNQKWTRSSIIAAIKAKHDGGPRAPTASTLGMSVVNAAVRHFGSLRAAQRAAGLTPNAPCRPTVRPTPPEPKPKPKPVVVGSPRPPHALSRDELAREREAHCRRMAEKWAKEPWTMPGYRGYRKPDGRMRSDFGSRERDLIRGHDDYLPPTDLVAWFQGRAA